MKERLRDGARWPRTPRKGGFADMVPAMDRHTLNKVPLVTLYFWIIKILATTVGETGADYLNFNLGFGLTTTSLLAGGLLVIALGVQFRSNRYVPWVYWLTVVFLSVVGTLITDNLTDNFGVSLYVSTAVFAAALGVTFVAWYYCEHTLSIHAITTTRREAFYWAAILFTFALGTAGGDLASEQLGLGYAVAGIIFAVLIAIAAIGYFTKSLHPVFAFWFAYVLTRPLGASVGDYLTQARNNGGLALSTTTVSAVFLVVIIALVTYLSVTHIDRAQHQPVAT